MSQDFLMAPIGTKARLRQDLPEIEWFKRELVLGKENVLTIQKIEVDRNSSEVWFEEVSGGYNTSAFETIEEFEPIDLEKWRQRLSCYL